MSNQNDLKVALTTQSNRDNDPNVTDNVTGEIKGSAMFQQPWQDLVQSVPVAIAATGSLYVASSSSVAQQFRFSPPAGGFQYIQDSSLDAALIRCGDQGRQAFMEAQAGLISVHDGTERANAVIDNLLETIADSSTAKRLIKPQMSQLKSFVDDCDSKVNSMNQKFESWLLYTCELHAICVGTQASDQEKLGATALSSVAEQTTFDPQGISMANVEAAINKLGVQLDVALDAFKKASDNIPTGWDILGEHTVSGYLDMATTALEQLMSGITSSNNPMARVGTGAGMFNSIMYPPDSNAGPPRNADLKVTSGVASVPLQQAPLPPYSGDPAYGTIQKDLPYLIVLLYMLTNGKDGGVDWVQLTGPDGTVNPVKYIIQVLSDAQSDFTKLATKDPPSQDLSSILATSIGVAKAARDAAISGSQAGGTLPTAYDGRVEQWQGAIRGRIRTAMTMAALARSLPGTSAGGIPLMANGPDPSVQLAQTNAGSIQAQATLECFRTRFSTVQASFSNSQQLYQKASSLLQTQSQTFGDTLAGLAKLTRQNFDLEGVKYVLKVTIELVINMKATIVDLCLFYKTMSLAIDGVVNTAVKDFVDDINANTAADGTDKSVFRIGSYTLSDLQRSIMYSALLTFRAQLLVFGDVASKWAHLSTQCILPGMDMLDQLSDPVNGNLQAQQKLASTLNSWSVGALADIQQTAGDMQKQTLQEMSNRVDAIQSATKQIPTSPFLQAAITAGTHTTEQAAENAIVYNANAKPINRFVV